MQVNKVAILSVVAILAISMVGVGLAYQASTENVNNEVKAAYISASFGDNVDNYIDAFGGNTFVFDYEEKVNVPQTGDPTVTKELKFSKVIDEDGNEVQKSESPAAYLMGTAALTIAIEGDDALPSALKLTVTPTGLNLTDFKICMKVGTAEAKEFTGQALEFDLTGSETSMNVDVSVFAVLKDEQAAIDPVGTIPKPYTDADFTFTVTEPA